MEWTAIKDGIPPEHTPAIICVEKLWVTTGCYCGKEFGWTWDEFDDFRDHQKVTHWMLFPPPPAG